MLAYSVFFTQNFLKFKILPIIKKKNFVGQFFKCQPRIEKTLWTPHIYSYHSLKSDRPWMKVLQYSLMKKLQ